MKDYQLFSDLDGNYGFGIIDTDDPEFYVEYRSDPKTGNSMTMEEAKIVAENILKMNRVASKSEFIGYFTDEDFGNFSEAVVSIDTRFANAFSVGPVSEELKELKALVAKFTLLTDFQFTEKDIKVLKSLCKEFNISVLQNL